MSKRPASALDADVPAAYADHVDKKRGLANAPPNAEVALPVEGGARTNADIEIPTSNEIAAPRGDAALRSPASGSSLVLAQPREAMEAETTNSEQPAKDTKRQKLQHISNITGACAMLKSRVQWFFDESVKLEEQQKKRQPSPPLSSSSGASHRSQGSASQRSQASTSSQQPPGLATAPKVHPGQGPHTSQSPAASQRSQPLPAPLPLNPSVLIACTGYLTSLKRWNRQVLEAGRESKASSAEARELVDLVQLELQNLRYECWHFEREIDKCESFKSKYQDVELVPEEEFLANAPPELVMQTDPHKRMLSRLKYEMMERIRLEQEKGNQLSLSMKLTKENREKRAAIENIEKELEGIYQNIIGVQGRLKLDITGTSTQEKAAPTSEK